jgi:hypothetical protein
MRATGVSYGVHQYSVANDVLAASGSGRGSNAPGRRAAARAWVALLPAAQDERRKWHWRPRSHRGAAHNDGRCGAGSQVDHTAAFETVEIPRQQNARRLRRLPRDAGRRPENSRPMSGSLPPVGHSSSSESFADVGSDDGRSRHHRGARVRFTTPAPFSRYRFRSGLAQRRAARCARRDTAGGDRWTPGDSTAS